MNHLPSLYFKLPTFGIIFNFKMKHIAKKNVYFIFKRNKKFSVNNKFLLK